MPQRFNELAHEIRGKLTAIHLAATLIHEGKAGPLTRELTEISGMIVNEAEGLHLAFREIVALVGPA